MNILILGMSGLVGQALRSALSGAHEVYGTYREHVPEGARADRWFRYDVADGPALNALLKAVRPEVVISTLRGDFADQIRAHEALAAHLRATGGRCVFVSTANVFDGMPGGSHVEYETPYAISGYGRFKIACEALLRDALGDACLTVRLPFTISRARALRFVEVVRQGEAVLSNLYMNCNTASRVAASVRHLIETEQGGVAHLTATDSIPQAEYLRLLLARFGMAVDFPTRTLTKETFCAELEQTDAALLRTDSADRFYVALSSVRRDLGVPPLSCAQIIETL